MQLTKNLKSEEVTCSCGCGGMPKISFVESLQKLRDACGFPLKINSGFRCEKQNAYVGGAKASTHMKGIAADIGWADMAPEQRHILLLNATKMFNGVGIHKNFLHVDERPNRIVFFY